MSGEPLRPVNFGEKGPNTLGFRQFPLEFFAKAF